MTFQIGRRYTPLHVVRRDSLVGSYEEVNSPLLTTTERTVQAALLHRAPERRTQRIFRRLLDCLRSPE